MSKHRLIIKLSLLIISLLIFSSIIVNADVTNDQLKTIVNDYINTCTVSGNNPEQIGCLKDKFPSSILKISSCSLSSNVKNCITPKIDDLIFENRNLLIQQIDFQDSSSDSSSDSNILSDTVSGGAGLVAKGIMAAFNGLLNVIAGVLTPAFEGVVKTAIESTFVTKVDVYGGNPNHVLTDTKDDQFHLIWATARAIAFVLIVFFVFYNGLRLLTNPNNDFVRMETRENFISLMFGAAFMTVYPFFLNIILYLITSTESFIWTFFSANGNGIQEVTETVVKAVTTGGGILLFTGGILIALVVLAKYTLMIILGFFLRIVLMKVMLALLPIALMCYFFTPTRKFGKTYIKLLFTCLLIAIPATLLFVISVTISQDITLGFLLPFLILFLITYIYIDIIRKVFDEFFEVDIMKQNKMLMDTMSMKNAREDSSNLRQGYNRTADNLNKVGPITETTHYDVGQQSGPITKTGRMNYLSYRAKQGFYNLKRKTGFGTPKFISSKGWFKK